MPEAGSPPPLTRRLLLAYGQLGLPLAMLALPLYLLLPVYYADGLGLGLALVGAVLLVARLWDLVTDPVIGLLSDRRIAGLSRRKPWLVAGTPVLMAGIWLLFLPPAGVDAGDLLLFSLLFYLGATMVMLPWLAWGAELTEGHHERSRVTGYREAFVVLGTVVAAGVAAALAEDPGAALRWIGIGLIVTLPFAVGWAVLAVPDRNPVAGTALGWRAGVTVLAQNQPFRCLISAWLVNGLANGLPAGLFLLFVTYRIGEPSLAGLFLLLYFGAGLAFIPAWLALSRRIGKHRAWIAAMVANCLFFAAVPLLGTGDVLAYGLVCVLTGACLGADLALPPSMQADVVDLDRAASGRQRTGLFFALWNMATKLSLALAVGIAFPVLDLAGLATAGSAGTATGGAVVAVNDTVALVTLSALYGVVPIVCKIAAIFLMIRYGRLMAGDAAATLQPFARKDSDVSTSPPPGGARLSHSRV